MSNAISQSGLVYFSSYSLPKGLVEAEDFYAV